MDPASATPDAVDHPAQPEPEKRKQKQKKPGHGRRGADAYPGARKKKVPHPDLLTRYGRVDEFYGALSAGALPCLGGGSSIFGFSLRLR